MGEIDRCRGLRIGADRLSFGNTIKREADIRQAHSIGINMFAFDSMAELEKLARAAPGSGVFCRMSVTNVGADWPLTRKFGCAPDMAAELLVKARTLGFRLCGISFHVGSQQTDPKQWRPAIAAATKIFRICARGGVDLSFLNVEGGFPGQHRSPIPALSVYADVIHGALRQHFGGAQPQIMVEPGRYSSRMRGCCVRRYS